MSSERHPTRLAGLAVLTIVTLSGCSAPGTIFEPLSEPVVWPAAPATPRIEYVGQLVTDRDLKPGKSLGAAIGEGFFGRKPARSMLSPFALCTDDADRLLVADSNAQLIHVFDLDTRRYEQWGAADDDTRFDQPVGIAWDERGRRVLVADSVAGVVSALNTQGVRFATIGAGELQRPSGVAVDPLTGRIFVADSAAHRVFVFDTAGVLLESIGGRGTELGRFNYPTNLAFDRQGRLYVSDSLNFRVQVFDTDLGVIRAVGGQGDLPGYFSQPKGVTVDSEDHLYVVDAHFEAVQVFDDQGRLLLSFGREGAGPGEFWIPAGIHADSKDRIWVADSYNRRVQVFQYLAEVPQ